MDLIQLANIALPVFLVVGANFLGLMVRQIGL